MKFARVAALAAATVLAAFGAQASSNLVANGGFEAGDFSGWTESGNFAFSGVATSSTSPGPESGLYFAYLGTVTAPSDLSQTLADNSGQAYQVSFWLDGSDTGFLNVSWNGTLLYSQTPSTTGWTDYTFKVVGTGSDTLLFNFSDSAGVINLDNVSVTAVPEPTAWALMLAGFAGLGATLRSRRRDEPLAPRRVI